MRTRAFATATVLIAACALTSQCSSSSKSSNETTTTTTNTYTISTADGQVTVSLDGQLPNEWPGGFPVPGDAKPAGSGSVAGDSQGFMVGVFSLSGSAQDAYDFYRNNTQLTVTDSSSVGTSKAFVGTVKFEGSYSGLVTIATLGSQNGLVIILHSGGTGSTGATTSTTSA
jgi:hypothetical protein